MADEPLQILRTFQEELVQIRRDLHAHPELGFEEQRTSGLVADKLAQWGIEVHRGLAKTGVVGVIRGRKDSGRTIGLRADMDCLAMQEAGDVAHRSKLEGRMHACGHDGHTAMLLGAARYLAQTRNFDGRVHLIFQPAEEGRGGGRLMVEEGLFERFACDAVYAIHNWPGLPPGKIAVRPGPILAASDELRIRVRGRGGHAALPHLAVDPVVIAGHIITTLQTIASRNADPVDSVVVSLCSMQTSQVGTFNVVPAQVELLGTVRTLTPEMRDLAERRIREITDGVARGLGGSSEVEYRRNYPPTVNHEAEAEFAAKVGERVFGSDNVVTDQEPTMGGEDFSFMLQARPGAYVWLGQGDDQGRRVLHNPTYDFNDETIPLGAGYLAALAEHALPIG